MRKLLLASVSMIIAAAFNNEGEYSPETCPTVLVNIDGHPDPVRVNLADFNVDQASESPKMTKVTDPAAIAASAAPAAPAAPSAPQQLLVAKEGTGAKARFIVTDAAGARVDLPGIDPNGYATDVEAWAAITAALAG